MRNFHILIVSAIYKYMYLNNVCKLLQRLTEALRHGPPTSVPQTSWAIAPMKLPGAAILTGKRVKCHRTGGARHGLVG